MKQQVEVVKVSEKGVLVKSRPGRECSKCCSCSASHSRTFEILSGYPPGVAEGDTMEIEIDDTVMMKAYWKIYGLPLLAFLAGLFVAYRLSEDPLVSFLVASVVMGIVYFGLMLYSRKEVSALPAVVKADGKK